MKKVLFASTALVLSAGIAAAEVTTTGDGRMGLTFKPDGSGDNVWNFTSRIRIKFTATGETDGGLSFGGSMRVDQQDASGGRASEGAAGSVFISGAFGKLEMGDVVGAAEAVLFDLPEVGLTDLDTPLAGAAGSGSNEVPFLTGDGVLVQDGNPVALYTYTTGSLTFAASLSDGKQNATGFGNAGYENQEYAVGVKYATDTWSVGLGYEVLSLDAGPAPAVDPDDLTQLTLGGTMTFGDTTVSAYAASRDNDSLENAYGIGVTSAFGAVAVNAYVNHFVGATGALLGGDDDDLTAYGLGASYDLGGGASIVAGIADDNGEIGGVGTDPIADFGIKMSF